MNAKFCIFRAFLALGLAGALTAAWGAESVINLISQGEAIQNEVKTTKAAQDDVTHRNRELEATDKQLVADQNKLQVDIAAYQKQNIDVKQQTTDYKSKCESKQLTPDQFKACKAQLAQINDAIAAVNTQPPILKKRQDDFIQRANKYNADIKDLQTESRTASANYSNALSKEEQWEYQASTLVASSAFQTVAQQQKANCPDVKKQPKTIDGIVRMSDQILTCLKKVAGTN